MNLDSMEGREEEAEEAHQMMHVTLAQGGALPDNRAYLDGCSTVTAFKTKKYLTGVKKTNAGIKINCNAGTVVTDLIGRYGTVDAWYTPGGIANIFSMHELKKKYRITYDSWEGYYVVHTPSGEVKFWKAENGLPYIDLEGSKEKAAVMLLETSSKRNEGEATMNVQTVRENYEGFTKREILKAKEARRRQALIGNPSESDYKGMVSGNMIRNCPITRNNITNARNIFGPDLASVRGKTVRRTPAPVVADYVEVPRALMEHNRVITMAADVFLVDGTAFLTTVSRRIKFVTAEHLDRRTATSLCKHLERVLQVYARAGFRVRTILMDGEFEKVKDCLPNVEYNTTAAKEHVSEAERTIRTIKERVRGLMATLPFTNIPRRMKIEFVYFAVLWLNAFPVKNGISSTYSPRELLVRWKLDYEKHCRVLPGEYCEAHDEPSPSNTMEWRTHEAIALGPTGNLQGSVKYYCLNTGRVLKRREFTRMPMPDRVIAKVNRIGLREKQGRDFWFLNRRKEPYEWTNTVPEDDPEFQGLLEEEEPAPYPEVSAELPGVLLESEDNEDFQVVTDEPSPDFEDLAAMALDNAGIIPADHLRRANLAAEQALDRKAHARRPALVEADEDEVVYKLTFDLPDAGLGNLVPPEPPAPAAAGGDPVPEDEDVRRSTRPRRSVVGNQPYDNYAPRVTFTQLGEV